MLKVKRLLIISVLVIAVFSLTGCVQVNNKNQASTTDGGIFKTTNKGVSWQQKVAVPTVSGKPKLFTGANVNVLVKDPGDDNALYLGTLGNGLYYTYDRANSWQYADGLGQRTIRTIEVDPNDKCTVYVAIGNKVFKTTDCSRSWEQVYFDNETKVNVNAIAVDHTDSNIVYIGVSRGDVIKSFDGGASWQTIYRIKKTIKKIIMDPNNSLRLFVVAQSKGVLFTVDGGSNWDDMNKVLKDTELGVNIKDMLFIKGEPEKMFIATRFGILITVDNGENWDKLDLLQPDKKAEINSIAVNPQNTNELYYVTNTTFYHSVDRGVNWTTIKLPTSKAAVELLINNSNPNELYMGVRSIED